MDYYRPTGVREKRPFESKSWNDGPERYHFKERRYYNNNNNNNESTEVRTNPRWN